MGRGRVFTGVGLLVIAASVVAALAANSGAPSGQPRSSDGLSLPATLAGSPLVSSVRGPAAILELSRLHGTSIGVAEAVVARYSEGITLWISRSRSALAASSLLWRMNRRMAGGTAVFAAPRPQERHGRMVFTTTGMGQEHVYYQSGSVLLWLAAPSSMVDRATAELLQRYP